MGITLWIVFGGLVRWVTSMIMKTDAQQGIVLNIIIRIIGAVLDGLIMSLLGEGDALRH